MIVLIQVIVVLLSFFLTTGLALVLTSVVPVAYIAMMGYGAVYGGREVPVDQLAKQLRIRWADSNELAGYMKKYWYSLKYSASASGRQYTAMSLAMSTLVVTIALAVRGSYAYAALSFIEFLALWAIAARVNKPLSMYKDVRVRLSEDEWCRNQWRLAASSIIAFAELFPENENYKFIADHVSKDELVKSSLPSWRR